MQEVIFYAEDYDVLLAEAERFGFAQPDTTGVLRIIVNGRLPDGGAYFFNYVGGIYEPQVSDVANEEDPVLIPGVWARLRLTGETPEIPKFSDSIRRYVYSHKAGRWVDAETREFTPDWVGNIGVIA